MIKLLQQAFNIPCHGQCSRSLGKRKHSAKSLRSLLTACCLTLMTGGLALPFNAHAQSSSVYSAQSFNELPQIGDTRSALISLDEEYRLGQTWLRILRAQAPQMRDPQIYDYVEDLVLRLATNSQLQEQRISLVVLKNPTLNAFAAPGSVIGIHGGLFRYAKTEGQFASVMAHEIAHLSQRHYAGQLDQQRRSLPLQIASILGGIVLAAASSSGDGAVAAMASSQAAFHDRRLSYSRQNEREADNIGMEILLRTGFSADAMPSMFQSMQQASRFSGDAPPEFLLTHPITKTRIAESLNRASQLPDSGRKDSLEYQLIRARTLVHLANNPQDAYRQFQTQIFGSDADQDSQAVQRYAAAFAAIQSNRADQAREHIDWLMQQDPDNRYFRQLQFEYWIDDNQAARAEAAIRPLLELYPGNHSLTMLLIDSLKQQRQYTQVVELLEAQIKRRPQDDQLWYQLAENRGQIDDISGVHQARAEYFLLTGSVKKAKEHLDLALRNPRTNAQEKAKIKALLQEAEQIREDLESL